MASGFNVRVYVDVNQLNSRHVVKVFDIRLEACQALNSTYGNKIYKFLFDELRRTSNIPYKCPFKGEPKWLSHIGSDFLNVKKDEQNSKDPGQKDKKQDTEYDEIKCTGPNYTSKTATLGSKGGEMINTTPKPTDQSGHSPVVNWPTVVPVYVVLWLDPMSNHTKDKPRSKVTSSVHSPHNKTRCTCSTSVSPDYNTQRWALSSRKHAL
ncbi:hypothetical protein FF38_11083 [Lucilia cuprina]|uniref:Uncharacterized protein n=1 Tax=Lucilia cuprina TaxID=7375 RepID=A0A0L0CRT9_LUCCU|nr:hypothetical protein FF38_11083 [Lucilia cuprina]